MNTKYLDYIPKIISPIRDPNTLPLLPDTFVKPIQTTLTQWEAHQEILRFSKQTEYGFTIGHGSRNEITTLTISRLYRNGSMPVLHATVKDGFKQK